MSGGNSERTMKWSSHQKLYLFFNSHQAREKFAVIFSNWLHVERQKKYVDKSNPGSVWAIDCFNHEIKSTVNYIVLKYDTTARSSPAYPLMEMLFHNGLISAVLITESSKVNYYFFLEGRQVDRWTLIAEGVVNAHLMDYLLRADSEEKALNQVFKNNPYYFFQENAKRERRERKIIYVAVLVSLMIISFVIRVIFLYGISKR